MQCSVCCVHFSNSCPVFNVQCTVSNVLCSVCCVMRHLDFSLALTHNQGHGTIVYGTITLFVKQINRVSQYCVSIYMKPVCGTKHSWPQSLSLLIFPHMLVIQEARKALMTRNYHNMIRLGVKKGDIQQGLGLPGKASLWVLSTGLKIWSLICTRFPELGMPLV